VDVWINRARNHLIAGSLMKELTDVLDRGGVSGEKSYTNRNAARWHFVFNVFEGGSVEVF